MLLFCFSSEIVFLSQNSIKKTGEAQSHYLGLRRGTNELIKFQPRAAGMSERGDAGGWGAAPSFGFGSKVEGLSDTKSGVWYI